MGELKAMSMAQTMNLNVNHIAAIRRVRDGGPEDWCVGGRAGGATSRMFERLANAGYVTRAPHKVTRKGNQLLDKLECRECTGRGHIVRRSTAMVGGDFQEQCKKCSGRGFALRR